MKITESQIRTVIKQELVKILNEMDETGMVPRAESVVGTVEIPSGYRSSGTSNRAYQAQKSSGIAKNALEEFLNAKQIIEGKQELNFAETSSFQASINSANNDLYHLNDERFKPIVDFFEDVLLATHRFMSSLIDPTVRFFTIKRSYLTFINAAINLLNTIIKN